MADGESSGFGVVVALGLGFGAGALAAVLMEPKRGPMARKARCETEGLTKSAELVMTPEGSPRLAEEIAQQAWFDLGRKGYRGPGPLQFEDYDRYSRDKFRERVENLTEYLGLMDARGERGRGSSKRGR